MDPFLLININLCLKLCCLLILYLSPQIDINLIIHIILIYIRGIFLKKGLLAFGYLNFGRSEHCLTDATPSTEYVRSDCSRYFDSVLVFHPLNADRTDNHS